MNPDLAKRWITHWEGKRATVYHDTKGIPTIGVGLNLLTAKSEALMRALGLDHAKVTAGEIALTDEQIDYCLSSSLTDALGAARAILPTFDYLPDGPALVMTDLAFNMGETRLRQFVHMLGYIKRSMFTLAADELRNSAWFREVGRRAVADVAVMGGIKTPDDILAG